MYFEMLNGFKGQWQFQRDVILDFCFECCGFFEDMVCGVKDVKFEDLDVEELQIILVVLMGGVYYLGQYCDKDFKIFMGC